MHTTGTTKSRRRRWAPLAATLCLTLVAAACNPIFGEDAGPVRKATLTSAKGFTYHYSGTDVITARASSASSDSNVREVFFDTERPFYADQQTCTTWHTNAVSDPNGAIQPGLAMRIAPAGPDNQHLRAVTVTENVIFGAVWLFNVHTWDTRRAGDPFALAGQFDLASIVLETRTDPTGATYQWLVDPPWYVCARTEGNRFTFKVWTHQDPEPGWDDPNHVFHTVLPAGWDHAGYSGGYVGHLRAGQQMTLGPFTTSPLCLVPELTDTPRCQAVLDATFPDP